MVENPQGDQGAVVWKEEAARPREQVCYLNLDHPTVPNWLWVNEQLHYSPAPQMPYYSPSHQHIATDVAQTQPPAQHQAHAQASLSAHIVQSDRSDS
ncbi:hypothetical protein PIB30_041323 [Stylosanthes scabra]|uniref:Uncharacterized protein n=1 Tax=Stylosanthes scabra TaxID=79078 RepID=A0ABU6UFD0_9FABA|nr:hypothetical protein [Stylosanthes scabra]